MTTPKLSDYEILELGNGKFIPRHKDKQDTGAQYKTFDECHAAIKDYVGSQQIVKVHEVEAE